MGTPSTGMNECSRDEIPVLTHWKIKCNPAPNIPAAGCAGAGHTLCIVGLSVHARARKRDWQASQSHLHAICPFVMRARTCNGESKGHPPVCNDDALLRKDLKHEMASNCCAAERACFDRDRRAGSAAPVCSRASPGRRARSHLLSLLNTFAMEAQDDPQTALDSNS
jgi:hypothetical protein